MKKVLLGIVTLAIIVAACNSKKEKSDAETLTKNDSVVVDQKDSTAVNTKIEVDNDGSLYISSDEQYHFRIISKQDESKPAKILLRNDISGRIYDMERVISASGEKYQDVDGNYFWLKGDNFSFGKADKVVAEGSIAGKPKEEH
ncbi:MliC family protein [Elizabethkingia anophelis]|uniref:Membrane-bound lysozyme-inhibitor of c-type lysozyme n=1 Tax=Elizabethkingia anophelis TaxID=1117645 RepID=A0A7Z7LZR2_9FLAO|nr:MULTISPECIES: MliC family protein [Elizabethkingia]ELB0067624.1 MliC family protein [Elizabethkingia anophelis]ELB0070556.1 MliC family protein [Elizabethkingia anophelis]ELB1892319.1 MliC family protein [Elizabethkingia anophelis]ELB1895321.1 MliC family protein [Elizabethkingia anophelis]MCT3628708.1 MliC family protein [Elizabethkingia anophelis]